MVGGKKVYFSDTGMLNVIGRVTDAQLLENGLINQIGKYGKISFYNKRNTEEIDLIYENRIALEIKSKGIDSDSIKLAKIAAKLGITESHVVSKEFVERPGFISPVVF